MDYFEIDGGFNLEGSIEVSGSKNAVLPIIAACILADTVCVLDNVPKLRDVNAMIDLLNHLGAKAYFDDNNSLVVDPSNINSTTASYDLVKKMRASICVLGPLVGKFGEAKVSMPGGCVIGPRPVDIHIKGLRCLGVNLSVDHGYIIATGKPKGGTTFLGGRFGSSVTATANILMASVLGEGKTIIESASMEPEITDLAHFLKKMGAKIEGIGSHALTIIGVKKLKGSQHTIISDRIEAGTFLLAGAITGSHLHVENANYNHLHCLCDKLKEAGANILTTDTGLQITAPKRFKSVDVITLPFPGFPTDLQAQMMALMSLADGIAVITEKIYPERYMHISELNRMGADISLEGPTAIIKGVKNLSGAPVMASDLRASAALVLAGLVANGKTIIERVYHIDRGYESIEKKLVGVGAKIVRKNK